MSHLPCLIVLRSLNQLFTGIHDKGTVAGNRFFDRLSAEDEKGRVLFGLEHHSLACMSEQGQFGFLDRLRPVNHDLPAEHEYRRVESLWQRQLSLMSCLQPKIVQVDRAERLCWAADAAKFTGGYRIGSVRPRTEKAIRIL